MKNIRDATPIIPLADYRITRLDDTIYRVVDTHAGRDGADILRNIEKLNFADVTAVDITLENKPALRAQFQCRLTSHSDVKQRSCGRSYNPMTVKDVVTVANRSGLKLIKVSDLLANDRDWQGDALHITTISDVVGRMRRAANDEMGRVAA